MDRPRLPVWKILSLRCDEATRLASRSQDEKLTRNEAWALAMHVFLCGACRKFRRQIEQLCKAISGRDSSLATIALSPAARARIGKSMSDDQSSSASGPG